MSVAARYEVSTCRHCREPIVRLVIDGKRADVVLRWLHTPARLNCLNVWREVLPTVAEVAQPPVAEVTPAARRRTQSDVRTQRRWAA